jgi:hypothetical protein
MDNFEFLIFAIKQLLKELRITETDLEIMAQGKSLPIENNSYPKVQLSKETAEKLLDGLRPHRRVRKHYPGW